MFSFETTGTDIEDLVDKILKYGGQLERNFEVIQTNVQNVSAVLDHEKRYILWSQNFIENTDPIIIWAAFSHEIGHHASKHTLGSEFHESEEADADFFMGYVMSFEGFSKGKIINAFKEGILKNNLSEERKANILNGCDKAESAMKIKSLGWENDPSEQNFLKAAFSFPPPKCYQSGELDNKLFVSCKTLGDIAGRFKELLGNHGYPLRFLSIPGEGFAIVTQIEQFAEDGSSLKGKNRWIQVPISESFEFSIKYFKRLFLPAKAQLRVFVFLVTTQNYSSSNEYASRNAAAAWMYQGVNDLPKSVRNIPFSTDFMLSALVYEFEVPETDHHPQQQCPCRLSPKTHLEKAGF